MAAAVELETLVYKLAGDATSYLQMLSLAQLKTEQTAREVVTAGQRIEKFGASLKGAAAAFAGALGAFGLAGSLRQALANFQEAEDISLRLNAALGANGREVDALRERYDAFAISLQNVTTAEDDAVLALLQTAETMGLTAEAAMRATRNAVALAAARGIDERSAIRLTVALEQGRSEMLGRFIPALRGIKDDSERAAKAQEMLAGMMSVAEARARSSAGQMQILRRDFGNMLEDFGKIVADWARPVVAGLSEIVKRFQEMEPATKKLLVVFVGLAGVSATILASVGPAVVVIGSMANSFHLVTGAVTGLASVTARFFTSMGGAMTLAAAGWVAIAGGIAYVGYRLFYAASGAQALNQALTRSAQLNQQLINVQNRGAARDLIYSSGITDPQQRADFLQRALTQGETRNSSAEAQVQAARDRLERARRADQGWDFSGALGVEVTEANAALREAEERARSASASLEELRSAFAAANDAAAGRDINLFAEMLEKIQDEVETVGMTDDERELYILRNVNPELLEYFQYQQEIRAMRRDRAGANEFLDDMAREMEILQGMTRAQQRANEAREAGNEEQALEIERRDGLMEYERYLQDLASRREAIIRQVDPRANFERQVRELNEIMASNDPLTQENYNRALQRYTEELNGAGAAADNAAAAVQRFQSAASGTVESAARLQDYISGATERRGGPGQARVGLPLADVPLLGGAIALATPLLPVLEQMRDFLRQMAEERGIELVGVGED